MESIKKIGKTVFLFGACLFLLWGSLFSGLRLWANLILARSGDSVRAYHVASFDRTAGFLASVVQMKRGDCKAVIVILQEIVRIYPSYWDAKNNLAICLASVGESDKSRRLWREILEEWPHHEAAKKNLAEINKKGRR